MAQFPPLPGQIPPCMFPVFLPHIFSCLDEKEKQRTTGIVDWIEGLLSGTEDLDVVRAEDEEDLEGGAESEDARLSETERDQGEGGDANKG